MNMAYGLADDEVRFMWQTAPHAHAAAGTTVILAPLPQRACLPADKAARRAGGAGGLEAREFVGRIAVWPTSFRRRDFVLRAIAAIAMMFPAPLFAQPLVG